MKVSDLARETGCAVLTKNFRDEEIETGYASDLLSDVMANAREGSVFITIQAHKNSVAVASQLDFPAIIICNNREVPSDMIDAAEAEGIAILASKESQYEISYKVHSALRG